MFGARALGLTRRMKRIAEADETADVELVGDHAGHAAAHRFAANEKAVELIASQLTHRFAPRIEQHRLAIGCPSVLPSPPPRHVRKLETNDADRTRRKRLRHAIHPRRVHRAAGAVRHDERVRRVVGSVEEHAAVT